MRKPVYILSCYTNEQFANTLRKKIPGSSLVHTKEFIFDVDSLHRVATSCVDEYFYLIQIDRDINFVNFNFMFTPSDWEKHYIHIWDSKTNLRMYHRDSVLENPEKYSDERFKTGKMEFMDHPEIIFTFPESDIVFISYDEPYAERHFQQLQERFPRTKRVKGVKGIYNAHKAAAELAESSMFYVVDADAEVVPEFNFDLKLYSVELNTVHVWHSKNPVNGLEYGYGGVKLFPTQMLLDYAGSPVDFTTTVSNSFKVVPTVSNITHFNIDPFSAWRSGFRECAKLASRIIHNQDNTETEERLRVWCTKGSDAMFGDFTIAGANEGAEFGRLNADKPEILGLINDFTWLELKFSA